MKKLFILSFLFIFLVSCGGDDIAKEKIDSILTLEARTDVSEQGFEKTSQFSSIMSRITNNSYKTELKHGEFKGYNRKQALSFSAEDTGRVKFFPLKNGNRSFSLSADIGKASSVYSGKCNDENRVDTKQNCLKRLEVDRNYGVIEWFDNTGKGIEHGFDIAERMSFDGEVDLEISVEGADVRQSGDGVVFLFDEKVVAQYRDLFVIDVAGKSISGTIKAVKDKIHLVFNDSDLEYPIVVDPTITGINATETKKITAGDGAADDYFGYSVSISEDTVAVGALYDDDNGSGSGSVYIFERNYGGADNWGQVQKLIAGDGAVNDYFGFSVSISGDTVAVGAYNDDDNENDSGSVYVFERNYGGADNWGQVQKLIAGGGAEYDYFGYSVSISGDTVAVGALYDDDNGNDSGSAYIFERNCGGADNWGEVKKLTPSEGAAGDSFGMSVSISGDTVAVGVPYNDDNGINSGRAYIFERNHGGADNWGEVKKITAGAGAADDSFGFSVSISGDTVAVGALYDDDNGSCSGSAYIFERNHGGADNWGEVKKITVLDGAAYDYFGSSVSISGDIVAVGAYLDDDKGDDSGSIYIFERNYGGADNWGEVKKITAGDGAADDFFGYSVSISGNTVAVGAYYNDDNGNDSGSGYIINLEKTGDPTAEKITASDGAVGDNFGHSVSISGDTVVFGAYGDEDKGSAYIFERNDGGADNWGEVKKITAGDGAADDNFGISVSISGDTVAVSAWKDDDKGSDSGSAYIFERNKDGADNWGEVKKITAGDGAADDRFGNSVSISGDTVAVGAFVDDDKGSAYIFERNYDGVDNWGEVKKLTAGDGALYDDFGNSVSISGDTVAVGAYRDNDNNNGSCSGSTYIFERNKDGADTWGQVQKLIASDGAGYDYFGRSVSISGDTVAVGADGDDDNGSRSGSAYIFERNDGGADNWGEVKKITAGDGVANDYFGHSVSISGDTVAVGAYGDDDNGNYSGSAYIFERNDGGADNWGEVKKITAGDGVADDNFGNSVSISGDTVAVGAYGDDDNGSGSGSAYIFYLLGKDVPTVTIWPTASDITYGQTLADSILSGGSASFEGSPVAGTFTFDDTTTLPDAGTASYDVTFTPTDIANYNTVAGTVSVTINKAIPTAALTITNTPVTYSGIAQTAVVEIGSSSVAGAVANIVNGIQTDTGTYAVTADFVPTDTTNYEILTELSAGNFVINKATPTAALTITNTPVTYSGIAQTAVVEIGSSSVAGAVANIVNGIQTDTGTYAVTADFVPTDTTNYEILTELSAGNFVINKATPTAALTITNTPVTYSGIAQAAVVEIGSSSVAGAVTNIANGTQTDAGTYVVTADFVPTNTSNYETLTGLSAGNFVINKASATVTLSDLVHTYDGTQKSAVATTNPAGLTVTFVYDPISPINIDSYAVTATVNEANYEGGTTGTLVIEEEINGVCENPKEIESIPCIHNGSTTGRESSMTDYGDYCGAETYPSKDFIYSIDLEAGDRIEIILIPAEGFNGVLAITNTCGENEDCLQFVDDGTDGGTETIFHESDEDETIYIIVEGNENSSGDYTLEVNEWIEETDDDSDTDAMTDMDEKTDADEQTDTDEEVTDIDEEMTDTDTDTGDTGNSGVDDDSVDMDSDALDDSNVYPGSEIDGGGCSCSMVSI